MVLYLYALADRVPALDGIAGIGGEPLVIVETVAARVIGGWLPAVPAAERVTLEAQDRVIRILHDRADALLPMRFGTAVADTGRAAEAVDVLAPGLADRLTLVRGREQMTLRVVRREGRPPVSAITTPVAMQSGTDYLRARAGKDVPAELVPLLEATRPLRRAMRSERGRHEAAVATIYELIDRGAADVYRTRVTDASARLPGMAVHVSGPAPAYAFAQP